ncbi:DUF5780 domain-containing protein [Acetoanaerobium sticklandii]|uniref:DUF5780 domain-containing protein n=1 Tax=Acetoanaerobium sticklandii TaxID=1511 RepID=UPI003A92A60E
MQKTDIIQNFKQAAFKAVLFLGSTHYLPFTEKHPKNKIVLLTSFGIVIIIALIITAVFIINNPVHAFMKSINNSDYVKATSVYNEKIKGNLEKEESLEEALKEEIKIIFDNYVDKTIDYNKANDMLNGIEKTGVLLKEINNAKTDINNLQNSRISFSTGIELENSKNYVEALIEFRKVIEKDENYELAKEKTEKIANNYKSDIIAQIDKIASDNNYEEAIKLIEQALKALPNDIDLVAKKTNYKKLYEEKKAEEQRLLKEKQAEDLRLLMEKLESEQEVYVVKTSQYTNIIDTNFIAVTVKNNTNKRVKSYTIGFMGFDKNGLPIKVGLGGGDFVGRGVNDQNILPGETKYSNGGWYLDNHDVKTLIACVDEVEYYDGDKWDNPYYQYWLEKYEEKPLE